jgi:ribokinase
VTHIAIFGSANIDLVAPVHRLPVRGETVMGGDLITVFGGKGANAAVAASRVGGTVHFVAKLGHDQYGANYLGHLNAEKIDTSHVSFCADCPTGTALILVDGEGQNMIVVSPGSNGRLTCDDVESARPVIQAAKVVLVQFEIPLDSVRRVIQIANECNVPVILNPSPYNNNFRFDGLKVNYLIVNDIEALEISGKSWDQPSGVVAELLNLGPRKVIVTRGGDETLVASKDELVKVAVSQIKVVDTVGAGDTFCGAFAVAVAEGKPLVAAVRFANCAAGLATTKMGAQASMPLREQVEALQ